MDNLRSAAPRDRNGRRRSESATENAWPSSTDHTVRDKASLVLDDQSGQAAQAGSAHLPGGFLHSLIEILRAYVEVFGDALFGLPRSLLDRLSQLALPHHHEGGLAVVDDIAEFLYVRAGHAAPQVATDPADGRACQGGADNRGREQDTDHRAGGRAAPRPVPGGHLVFVDVHLAVG